MMARIRIQFFGGFEIYDRNDAPIRLPSRNAAALLAILAVGRGRMQSRTKIANLLWDSSDSEHARGSLRQTLFILRRALGREALREQTEALRLDEASVQTDLWDFTDEVERGTPDALSRAVDMYRGEFLEAHSCDRSVALEEWLDNERLRVRDTALRAFNELLDIVLCRGAFEDAQRTAMRILTIDPAEETAHRALMQIHANERRYGQAMRQFERCRRVLQLELNVEPDAQTRQLHADIVQSRAARFPTPMRISPAAMAMGVRKSA